MAKTVSIYWYVYLLNYLYCKCNIIKNMARGKERFATEPYLYSSESQVEKPLLNIYFKQNTI